MQTTQYYGLKKPEETDVATPEDFNNNMLNFPSTDFQIKPEYMWLGIASNRLLYFL